MLGFERSRAKLPARMLKASIRWDGQCQPQLAISFRIAVMLPKRSRRGGIDGRYRAELMQLMEAFLQPADSISWVDWRFAGGWRENS